MSAEQNVARIPRDSLSELNDELRVVQKRRRAPIAMRYIRLRELADHAAAVVAPATACRGKGCSHCCRMAADVPRHEAEVIARATGRKLVIPDTAVELKTVEGLQDAIRETRARWTGVPCTFLAPDGSCSIYAVRPLACRMHHSVEDTPDRCDIDAHPGATVASVNLQSLLVVIGDQLGPVWADIREWFPPDEEKPRERGCEGAGERAGRVGRLP